MAFAEFCYSTVIVLAVLNLTVCAVVVFWTTFCAGVAFLLVSLISGYNLFLLVSGTQRLAQHDGVTLGLFGIIAVQAVTVGVHGWILWDGRSRR